MNTKDLETTYQLPTYAKIPLALKKGKGVYVWDENGKKYLDFYGGHAVVIIGHCHPEFIKAVYKQLKTLIFYSNIVYNKQRGLAAKHLVDSAGENFSNVFFCNSGAESNEAAIKLAKKFTGKDEIIAFSEGFHGRTIGALSVTGFEKYQKGFGSMMPNVKFAKFGDIKSVKNLITNNTAAIILEPIQSVAGINEAEPSFYKILREICDEKEIVLIFDEIQTGLGRTGKMFYGEHIGITPDLITLAKGIAGGLPAGAVLIKKEIAEIIQIEDHASTFGGGPVISAAISATLKIIADENLISNAEKLGKFLKKELSKIPHVLSVNGKGLLLGIHLDIPAAQIKDKLLQKRIITGTASNKYILRLMPPLIITNKETSLFINALKSILEEAYE